MYDEVTICGMVNTVKPDLKSRQEVETWHVRPFPELRLAHKSLIQTDTDREDSLFFTFFLPPSLHFFFFTFQFMHWFMVGIHTGKRTL